jgi:MFS transporter, ACS family, tartrate transporter
MVEKSSATSLPAESEPLRRKIALRILPLLLVLYVMSYLDRTNVAFARVPMSEELGFTDATYGLGSGLFFVGYFFLGIPGALIVEKWGARRLIGFSAIGWGTVTVLFALVRTSMHFNLLRFLLGLSAAAFFPGVIVYLTHWFPQRDRSRALAGFLIAAPISLTLGGPLSALILRAHAMGLRGWQWIFVLEGLATICLGMIVLLILRDSPENVPWLHENERERLRRSIDEGDQNVDTKGSQERWWEILCRRNILFLCIAYAFVNIAGYGFIFWLPTTVKTTMGSAAGVADTVTAVPFGLSVIVMWLAARSSDRTGERRLHACVPMLCIGSLYLLTIIPGQSSAAILVWTCLAGAFLYGWIPGFWALPTAISTGSARAASIGLINSIGNLGGFVGPTIIGQLLTKTHSSKSLVILVSASYCLAAAFTSRIKSAAARPLR